MESNVHIRARHDHNLELVIDLVCVLCKWPFKTTHVIVPQREGVIHVFLDLPYGDFLLKVVYTCACFFKHFSLKFMRKKRYI